MAIFSGGDGLGGGFGSTTGGILTGAIGAGISFGLSRKNAADQRNWSRNMRQTAYQDTMADMKASGLNPLLAYKLGPTGIGQGAVAQVPDFASAMTGGINAVTGASKLKGQKGLLAAQTGAATSAQNASDKQALLAHESALLTAAKTRGEGLVNVGKEADALANEERREWNDSTWGRFLNKYGPAASALGTGARDLGLGFFFGAKGLGAAKKSKIFLKKGDKSKPFKSPRNSITPSTKREIDHLDFLNRKRRTGRVVRDSHLRSSGGKGY